MLGAGIFVVLAPAAAAAGTGLLIGLGIAAAVAYCNATSSARLAARYPQSGGTYVYGRERLGEFWGYTAGWSFVVGKTASCAAMALTVGYYVWPGAGPRSRGGGGGRADDPELHRHPEVRAADPRHRRRGPCRARRRGGRHPRLRRCRRRTDRDRYRHLRPWRAAGGGPAVLRFRRLRTDRHPRRGGARSGSDDPTRHPDRADHRTGGLRRGRRRSTRRIRQ